MSIFPINFFKEIKERLKMSPNLWVALLGIFLFGIGLLYSSRILEENSLYGYKITHEVGVLCITITPMLFIYELALRRHFIREMNLQIEEVITKMGIKKEILGIVRKSMPLSYNNILENGVTDAFPDLEARHLRERIEFAHDTDIKLVKIWMPFLDEAIEPHLFIEAVDKRNCIIKIVLFDPECGEAIDKRVRTLNYKQDYYKINIEANLRYFQSVWTELHKVGKSDKLQIKLHDDFICVSLIGFKDYYIFGSYLHGRLATRTMQFKIDKGRDGKETEFFKQLDQHFEHQWKIAYKNVIYNENSYVIEFVNSK